MDLNRFEELWPQRGRLEPETRLELERLSERDKHCRAFTRTGVEVRQVCLSIPPEKAPENFSYRMRVYAENHLEEHEGVAPTPRGIWRWATVTTGVVTGAVVMFLALSPLRDPQLVGESGPGDNPAKLSRGPAVAPMSARQVAASSVEEMVSDSLARQDSLGMEAGAQPLPNWQLRTVSSGGQ